MPTDQVKYGEKIIQFEVIRKDVKNINLNVRPDMTVVISASEDVPIDYIKDIVKDKADWIIGKIHYFKDTQPIDAEKEYVSGESVKYLGKQYRLKIVESEDNSIKLYRGYIYLFVSDREDYELKEKLISKWLMGKAEEHFEKSFDRIFPKIKKYGISKPELIIKSMKARWGSCVIDSNKIILNYELIKAPKYCIDYVFLHELIHFRYSHHDDNFYTFLTALMPDWKQRKKILDEEVVREL